MNFFLRFSFFIGLASETFKALCIVASEIERLFNLNFKYLLNHFLNVGGNIPQRLQTYVAFFISWYSVTHPNRAFICLSIAS